MKFGELSEFIPKIIWDSADAGGHILFRLSRDPVIHAGIFKEYIYLKAGLATRLVYQAYSGDDRKEADMLIARVLDILQDVYDNASVSSTYGGTSSELRARVAAYKKTLPNRNLDEVSTLFLNFLRGQKSPYCAQLVMKTNPLQFVEYVETDLKGKLVQFQNSHRGSSGGGGGCLSVIACASILIVALLAFACI